MAAHARRLVFLLAVAGVWALVARGADSYLVPGPVDVGSAIARAARNGSLVRAVARSLQRLAVGYGVSLLLGVTLGIGLGRSKWLRETIGTLALGLQAIPSICWLPLALLWFGLNDAAILMVVVLGSLLAVSLATESAVRAVPPLYIRAARTMGARGLTLWLRVLLPAALPGILSGARLGWTFAWRSLMAGELIFVSGGLGQLLQSGRELHDMAQVVGVMVVIVAVGLVSEYVIFARLESQVRRRWGLERA